MPEGSRGSTEGGSGLGHRSLPSSRPNPVPLLRTYLSISRCRGQHQVEWTTERQIGRVGSGEAEELYSGEVGSVTSRGATRVALAAANIGGLASAAGFVASCWVQTGTTPALVYEYFTDLRSWSPGHLVVGVPSELIAAFTFAAAGWLAATPRVPADLKNVSVFVFGVGGAAWWGLEVSDHGPRLTTAIAGFLSSATLIFAASTGQLALRSALKDVSASARTVVRDSRLRATALTALCAVVFSCVGAAFVLNSVRIPGVAPATRNFERWFKVQAAEAGRPALATTAIEILVFVEFGTLRSRVAQSFLTRLASEQPAGGRGRPVSIVLRAFTPKGKCLEPTQSVVCETAAAALFVLSKDPLGQSAEAFSRWLFESPQPPSSGELTTRLTDMGLGAAWLVERQAFLGRVALDHAEVARRDIRSAPTAFVNGIPTPFQLIREALQLSQTRDGLR
jgi:hypothetical protein